MGVRFIDQAKLGRIKNKGKALLFRETLRNMSVSRMAKTWMLWCKRKGGRRV